MRTRIWHSDWKPRWLIRCVSAALLSFMDKQDAVCPGYVRTSMQDREVVWEGKLRNMTAQAVRDEYIAATPLGRLEEPEDVAAIVVFLASDLSGFLTGEAINASGGVLMD